jgi:hypothetical protein
LGGVLADVPGEKTSVIVYSRARMVLFGNIPRRVATNSGRGIEADQ